MKVKLFVGLFSHCDKGSRIDFPNKLKFLNKISGTFCNGYRIFNNVQITGL